MMKSLKRQTEWWVGEYTDDEELEKTSMRKSLKDKHDEELERQTWWRVRKDKYMKS